MKEKIELIAEWQNCQLSDFLHLDKRDLEIIVKALNEYDSDTYLDIGKITRAEFEVVKAKMLARQHIVYDTSIIDVKHD